MSEHEGSFFKGLAKSLRGEITRARDTLVPPAFQVLWEVIRFIVLYGGRSAAKSWSIARVLLVLASEQPLRILCCREIQGSLKESAYRLLCDQISALGLDEQFEVQADCIVGKCGSRFYFEGLRYNASKIRSYEAIDLTWVEEAQSVSELSWETLLPTIRKPGSRFFISFNPMQPDDPVLKRFVESKRPDCIAKKVSYRDNPHFSAESEAERAWLEQTDPDSYRHVWEGEPRLISDAQILKGKYFVGAFEIDPRWAGPYFGCDFGFAKDPSAGLRCFVDPDARVLYVSDEFWQLGCDIDHLPAALEQAIPGIARGVVQCDSSRPETVSYLQRHGIPAARSAEKWPGSVDDGVMYLRQFAKIIIDPKCVHTIDEARAYSFKVDRFTGQPLAQVEDKHNHCIDALRYALSPLIRNTTSTGFFNRAAFLVDGQPIESQSASQMVLGVLSTSTRPGSAVGLVVLATSPHDCPRQLTVIDWHLAEIGDAAKLEWLAQAYRRVCELAVEWKALNTPPVILVEAESYGKAAYDTCLTHFWGTGEAPNLMQIDRGRGVPIPTLEQLALDTRATLNSGAVKIGRAAFEADQSFRNAATNHLLSQVLGFRLEAKDAAADLVLALVTAVSLWDKGEI